MKYAAVLLGTMLAASAMAADQDGVQFQVLLMRDGKIVSSPTVVGVFGKPVRVDLSQTMKVEAVASAPESDGSSLTAVKLSLFENGEMGPAKEMSMRADLSKTPSFEYSVPGTNARFVVMPRLVKLPAKG
jgi:hypothetical protein